MRKKPTILITEGLDYSKKAIKCYEGFGKVLFYENLKGEELDIALKEAEIIVIRLRHKIGSDWLEKMPNLKIVATPTTGLNHLDLLALEERGVRVVSLKGKTSFLRKIKSTAELTFGLLLALVRHIPSAHLDVIFGNWNRDAWRGNQLREKTLGIVGLGRLVVIVARYAKAFETKVIAYDPNVSTVVMKKSGVKKVKTLADLFKISDIVSVHVPLEKETEKLIGDKEFAVAKAGLLLVNTSRGKVIDEEALFQALKNNKIGGAAIDVMTNESADGKHLKNNKLLDYAKNNNNLIIVPHIGGASFEAMHITEEFIAEEVSLVSKKR